MRTRVFRLLGLSVVALMLAGAAPFAQQPASPPSPGSQEPSVSPGVEYPKVVLTAGRSKVLATDFDITRLAITNPAVADAVVVTPREVLIDGKAAGTVSMILWGTGNRMQYDIVVDTGVLVLEQQLKTLFPGEDIRVSVNDEALILSGSVSSNAIMLRAAEIAAASSGKLRVINMLQLPGGNESQQVMLQVRFAEVNRSALKELGSEPGREPRRLGRPDHDWPVRGAGHRRQHHDVQRFPQYLLLFKARRHRRRPSGAPEQGILPEPCRAEPDCL